MPGFFEEIKRRKVYRVAAAYAVVAGGAIQLAGHELSRARGGPRCMTMPLEREDV